MIQESNFYLPKPQVLLTICEAAHFHDGEKATFWLKILKTKKSFFPPLTHIYRSPEVHPRTPRIRDSDPKNLSDSMGQLLRHAKCSANSPGASRNTVLQFSPTHKTNEIQKIRQSFIDWHTLSKMGNST